MQVGRKLRHTCCLFVVHTVFSVSHTRIGAIPLPCPGTAGIARFLAAKWLEVPLRANSGIFVVFRVEVASQFFEGEGFVHPENRTLYAGGGSGQTIA